MAGMAEGVADRSWRGKGATAGRDRRQQTGRAASESVTRDQGVRRAGHSGAVAVASVMATAGATDAVWHVRGLGEPEREWPRDAEEELKARACATGSIQGAQWLPLQWQ